MKLNSAILFTAVLGSSLGLATAQMGGMGMGGGMGPQFNGPILKLFGDHTAFSATVNMEAKVPALGDNTTISLPAKVSLDSGKARAEIELSQIKGLPLPPEVIQQFKTMGMDKMVIISSPDKKTVCMIYPGLKAYVNMPMEDADAVKPQSAFKLAKTEAGKETVAGHSCVKYKATVSDDKDQKHEYTLWSASDLKDFPVKIEFVEDGNPVTMQMTEIKLAKPAANLFEAPSDYKKYDDMMALARDQAAKAMPPGAHGPGAGGPPPGN